MERERELNACCLEKRGRSLVHRERALQIGAQRERGRGLARVLVEGSGVNTPA